MADAPKRLQQPDEKLLVGVGHIQVIQIVVIEA